MQKIQFIRKLRPTPGIEVIWSLGNFCTYSCSYCGPIFHRGDIDFHDFELIEKSLHSIPPESTIIFSGGEPTIHPRFEDIVKLEVNNIKFGVISNASRPPAFWNRVMPYMSKIILSYHAEFTKIDKFVNVAEACRSKLIRINLNMMPELWDTCVEAYHILTELNFPVSPKPLVENFGVWATSLSTKYTEDQIRWINDHTPVERDYIGLYDKDYNLIETSNPAKMIALGQTNFNGWECFTPTKTTYISFNGGVYTTSCPQRKQVGSIKEGFTIPTESVICEQNFCWCHSDISPPKVRKE